MNKFWTFLVAGAGVIWLNCIKAEPKVLSERTAQHQRAEFYDELNETIDSVFSDEINPQNQDEWAGAFWAANLVLRRDSVTENAVKNTLRQCERLHQETCRWALESAIMLNSGELQDEFEYIFHRTGNTKLKVMAAYGSHKAGNSELINTLANELQETKSPDPVSAAFKFWFKSREREFTTAEIVALMEHNFPDDVPVFYSFHRSNRNYPGLTILRKTGGTFAEDSEGELSTVPQLARAISNMPGILTNGNSPAGIYVINGTGYSDNVFIGPSETLVTRLPVEADVSEFLPEAADTASWSEHHYQKLLPEIFDKNHKIWEAYYAGMAGRTEIISHGTTINPEFYINESYYPFTPSLGCLTSVEIWDAETGVRLKSGQTKLLDMWSSQNASRGYFIVIDINDRKGPVTRKEIELIIKDVSKRVQ